MGVVAIGDRNATDDNVAIGEATVAELGEGAKAAEGVGSDGG